MRRYETICIIRPNVAEDEIDAVISKTTSIIESDSGTIIKIDKWGLKKLAYLIKKEAQGYYVYIDFAAIPASVSEIERIFRIDDRVLKYLTVKLAESCDPEAILEEMAIAESARTSAEAEATEEVTPSPSKPAETPVKAEAKEEESSPSEPAENPAEAEAKEEESNPSDEEKDA